MEKVDPRTPEGSAPRIGEVLAGKYRIEQVLGRGGVGTVYGARHLVTEREVAIKWLRSELARDPEWMRRFVREARAAGRVHHAGVVDVYDVDEHAGTIFLVMERLIGRPFSEVCEAGPLSVARALELLLPAMRGMHALHRHGVIHRDLKPANIFVCEDAAGVVSGVKVLDFGIAKILDAGSDVSSTTETGAHLGTPNYMAPEQLGDAAVLDQRVDVYAFAVVLYRALAGRLPFSADSPAGVVLKITTQQAPPLHEVAPAVPEALSRVVAMAMAPRRDERYADLAELLAALAPFAEPSPRAGSLREGSEPAATSASHEAQTPTTGRRSASPRSWTDVATTSGVWRRPGPLATPTPSKGPPAVTGALARWRVLVIDDSEIMLDRIRRTLEGEGYDVVTTTRPVGNARYLPSCDLILIDYHMPGIDGATVVRSLRDAATSSTHPCLLYLYTSDPQVGREHVALGFDGVLTAKGDEAALARQLRALFRIVQMREMQAQRTPPKDAP